MDQKGFLASMDAILGLVILMVLMGAVVNVNNTHQNTYSQEVGFTNQAQEAMELMATYNDSSNGSIFAQIVNELEKGDSGVKSAGNIAGDFLNKIISLNYKFTEIKKLNGTTIISKGDIEGSKNVNSAIWSYDDYTFQLYVGR